MNNYLNEMGDGETASENLEDATSQDDEDLNDETEEDSLLHKNSVMSMLNTLTAHFPQLVDFQMTALCVNPYLPSSTIDLVFRIPRATLDPLGFLVGVFLVNTLQSPA